MINQIMCFMLIVIVPSGPRATTSNEQHSFTEHESNQKSTVLHLKQSASQTPFAWGLKHYGHLRSRSFRSIISPAVNNAMLSIRSIFAQLLFVIALSVIEIDHHRCVTDHPSYVCMGYGWLAVTTWSPWNIIVSAMAITTPAMLILYSLIMH